MVDDNKSLPLKFRILELTSSSDIGGTERMLLKFFSGADRERFDWTNYATTGSGILARECNNLGIEAENFVINSPADVFDFAKLLAKINRKRFHLIHSYGLRADLIARLFVKKWDAIHPVLVSGIRSIDPHRKPWQVFLDGKTGRKVSLFISNSEAGRKVRISREKFPAEKILTIYNGISDEIKYNAGDKIRIREKYNFESDEILIGHISNIRSMKGHEEVLEAAQKIVAINPKVKFVFVGRDDSKGKIPALAAEKKLRDYVWFLGFHQNPEEILAAIDIFILPSHWEGFPTSVLEAMLYRKPVIASNVGGIPEMIDDGVDGILIPPKNPEALAEALLKMLSDPDFADMLGENARRKALEKFRLKDMIEKIQNAYLSALDKNRQPS